MIDWIDLPQLKKVAIGNSAFTNNSVLTLESMRINDWLNWSSSARCFRLWREYIQTEQNSDIQQLIDWWLIDMVFLNFQVYRQDLAPFTSVRVWLWKVWWWLIDWLDLPNLKLFKTGKKSFHKVKSLVLSSMVTDNWLIRSSSIEWIEDRRWVVLPY